MKSQRVQRFPAFLFFSFLAFASSAQETAPTIVCPTTPVEFLDVTSNDPAFWNAPYWWDPSIESHNIGDAPAPLEISATNHCNSGTLSFHFQLRLDLDGDRVFETYVNSDQLPGPNTILYENPNWLPENRAFDSRPVPSNRKWGFALKVLPEDANHTQKAFVIWKDSLGNETTPLIPYGSHRIRWTVKDDCGKASTCTQRFVVRDAAPPELYCVNQLNATMNSNSSIMIWASDLLVYAYDNYTPPTLLPQGIRKSNTGTGYPEQTSISYSCEEQGVNSIELWTKDRAGNTSFCTSNLEILLNGAPCGPEVAPMFRACIQTEDGFYPEEVAFVLNQGPIPTISDFFYFDDYACKDINLNEFSTDTLTATPINDSDPLNGVNTYDLILITNHILNVSLLDSPYKLIAADADNNSIVTTHDIVEIRKLILGIYNNLPNNTSWRYIDQTQVFADPLNLSADSLIESFPIFYHTDSTIYYTFIGVKIGDVDNSSEPNNLLAPDDRTSTTFNITRKDDKNGFMQEGEVVELIFEAASALSGYQMTLETNGLKVSEIIPGGGMSSDNFGLFEHAVTSVCEKGNAPFSIRFIAEKSGYLRDMLAVSSRITPAMAFGKTGEKMPINLHFTNEKNSTSPNPWTDHTRITFQTSTVTTATLKVFDVAGKLVYTTSCAVEKGEQAFELNGAQVPAIGTLFYEIKTAAGESFFGKMIKQ